jgi:hypothetical protein
MDYKYAWTADDYRWVQPMSGPVTYPRLPDKWVTMLTMYKLYCRPIIYAYSELAGEV